MRKGEMNLFFKNKKSNAVIDTITVIIVLLAFSIISILGYSTFKTVMPDIMANSNSTEANATMTQIDTFYPSSLDGAFMFIFVGLWIVALVASFMLDSHPIFFFVAIILLVFICIASAILSNFFEETMLESEFSSVAGSFPMTVWVMEHMLMIAIIIGFSIVLTMYAKSAW